MLCSPPICTISMLRNCVFVASGCFCNAATNRYSQLNFGHMHLCGKDYKYLSPHCCRCNSFGCTATIRCGYACHGPHIDSVYSGSEHNQLNSPRQGKRESDFPSPRWALIDSNQLWRVNDSQYNREYELNVGLLLNSVNKFLYWWFLYTSGKII